MIEILFTCLFASWAVTERVLSFRERGQLMDELADLAEEAHKRELALLKALKESCEGKPIQVMPFPSPAPHVRRPPPSPPAPAAQAPHMDDEAEAVYEQMRSQGMSDDQIVARLTQMQQAAG